MKTFWIYLSLLVSLCSFFSSCESIDDTYKEHAGDGPVQYLNIIYDLQAIPQWESVLLNWELKLDPARTAILVEWKDEKETHSELIDKDAESFLIENLTSNYDYEFNVWAVTVENSEITKKSLGEAVYARPFNMNSDELSLFTHVVTKQIKVADKKIFAIFDSWADNLVSFKIGYFEKGNAEEQFFIAESDDKINNLPMGKPYAIIGEDVDFSKPINIYRTGIIESFGNKTLELAPLTLYFDLPILNNDFATEIRPQIGLYGEIRHEDISDVTSININFNQTSLEDLLYFPKLETINLGKDRYLMMGTKETVKSTLSSESAKQISLAALKLMTEVVGTKINQYGKHYFDQAQEWFFGKNLTAELPHIQLLNAEQWDITETPSDVMGYDTGLWNLLSDNGLYWLPTASLQVKVHTIEIDMKKTEDILGFKIVQADIEDPDLQLPELLSVEMMTPSGTWEPASFTKEVMIGNGKGETSLVYLNKEKSSLQANKVRVSITDSFYKNGYDDNWNYVTYYRTGLSSFLIFTD